MAESVQVPEGCPVDVCPRKFCGALDCICPPCGCARCEKRANAARHIRTAIAVESVVADLAPEPRSQLFDASEGA